MVMEYLDGEPLSDRIKRLRRLSPEQAVPLFRQMLEGLGAAHESGILHRDLKPDNIFILNERAGNQDFIKIIDFGISKFQPLAGEMKMTRTGTIMGTPYYMSPEQASGAREMNVQSDIYAIGVILYEALSGAVPFDAPTFNQLMFRIVLSEAAPIEALVPDINPAFATIIKKAMAREQAHRFTSCQEFSDALDAWAATGSGVDVPPVAASDTYLPEGAASEAVSAATGQAVALGAAGVVQPGASGAVLSRTNQAWANTAGGPDGAPARKSKAPLFIGAAALAGLLVVGGAAAVVLLGSSDDDATAAAAAALQQETTVATAPAVPNEAPAENEEDEGAEDERAEEPPSEDTEIAEAAPSAEATATTAASEATEPAAPVVHKKRAPRPKAPTPNKPPSESKRRDFGY
jgi:serine/threonine-protein kinase